MNVSINLKLLVRVLDGAIKSRNLSGRLAAEEMGVSASTLSRLRLGQSSNVEGYARICLWLGVSLDTFVEAE